jgi:RAD50-interacting protein 1
VGDNLAEAMSYEAVRNSTSASVGSDDDGAVFDETVGAYKKRQKHAEQLMIESIRHSLPATLRAYINKPNWLTVDISEAGNSPYPHAGRLFTNLMQVYKPQ